MSCTFIIALVATAAAIFIAYFKWSHQYWKRKDLPYLEPSIPFGNLVSPARRTESIGISIKKIYDTMKSKGWKHGGIYIFTSPIYLVLDLDYLKNILAKDFNHFVDRGIYYNEKDDPLSAHLFAIGGPKWRSLRTKLTPTFTSGKLKTMFQTLVDCLGSLEEAVTLSHEQNHPVDIKELLGCFTTNIIGSCAFGLDCNTFQDDNSPFRVHGRRIFTSKPFEQFKFSIAMNFPKFAKYLRMITTPKDTSAFFMKVVKDTVEYREKNNVTRNDFLQLLIEMKNQNSLTIEEMAAQCFIFFLAGFETSSSTMTFALYELARNQEVQEKVREEIKAVLAKHDQKITYESINDMKYMNQVINETLRKYPPVPFVTRVCVKDYNMPGTDLVINKGTRVFVPILGIHYDPEYFPEPETFDPERFSEENKRQRHQYSHMPFGEGARICIGMRFGMMQTKVGLTSLLKNYRWTVNKKTAEPLKMKVSSFILAADGEIWLDAKKL